MDDVILNLSEALSRNMQAMVGFRNVAIQQYQKSNLEIVKSILTERLIDFQTFIKLILQHH